MTNQELKPILKLTLYYLACWILMLILKYIFIYFEIEINLKGIINIMYQVWLALILFCGVQYLVNLVKK